MTIKPGIYKTYLNVRYTPASEFVEYENPYYMILYVGDYNPSVAGASERLIMEDQVLNELGQELVENIPQLKQYINVYDWGWYFSTGPSQATIDTANVSLINTAGVLGMSLSPCKNASDFTRATTMTINYYLQPEKTQLIWYEQYSGSGGTTHDGPTRIGESGGTTGVSVRVPLIRVSEDLTVMNMGYIRISYSGSAWLVLRSANRATEYLRFFDGVEPVIISRDPYNAGGTTGKAGGTGDFDGTSDPVNFPSLPSVSATDTGFITIFNPSPSELKNLANYMWGDLFDLNTWKKIFADPMDAILGMSVVPVSIPNGGSRAVTIGNISTGITMNIAGSQYVEVDCGSVNVNEYWGAYLDYEPYTKAELYLPYIGTHAISTDDIMGKTVHIKYHVDILSGACCAYVKCGDSVLYSFVGQCSCSIPITGNDWTNVVNGALSIATAIGTMVATGGASAPFSAPSIAATATNSLKPTVEKSGALGGMGGMLGIQKPFIILTRPRQALPDMQNEIIGYPSYINANLGAISGYTEIDEIHLVGIPATENELTEIETLLKGGIIL